MSFTEFERRPLSSSITFITCSFIKIVIPPSFVPVQSLPSSSTEIPVQTLEEEKKVSEEQIVENEAFEEQGKIAYNGTNEYPSVKLGSYVGLTYYSQIDNRWKNNMYSSIADTSQTIGTSGCGPTCASMVVTAIKGTITPPEMCNLFVKYGYRSANNGTYWSAFRFVADTFNIGYQEQDK